MRHLYIVEMAITSATSMSATLMDMAMLASFTGQERELSQLRGYSTLPDSH
jgi:hypothetical protein